MNRLLLRVGSLLSSLLHGSARLADFLGLPGLRTAGIVKVHGFLVGRSPLHLGAVLVALSFLRVEVTMIVGYAARQIDRLLIKLTDVLLHLNWNNSLLGLVAYALGYGGLGDESEISANLTGRRRRWRWLAYALLLAYLTSANGLDDAVLAHALALANLPEAGLARRRRRRRLTELLLAHLTDACGGRQASLADLARLTWRRHGRLDGMIALLVGVGAVRDPGTWHGLSDSRWSQRSREAVRGTGSRATSLPLATPAASLNYFDAPVGGAGTTVHAVSR